jgi:hypothetical protein
MVPKRLRSELISNVAISSSLYGASHQAADKISTGNDIDEQRRRGGDDRGRHVDVVFDHARRGVDEIVDATVIGAESPAAKVDPNRKSFQMLVNW